MKYPNNDLWSVRQIEFLKDALEGFANTEVDYYPSKKLTLDIPGIAVYEYLGVLHFAGRDRTVIFEQGDGYGLKQPEIINYLAEMGISYSIK